MFEFNPDRAPIPPRILRQMPGSVAWECRAIPLADERELVVALADAEDRETVEKLRFVLNREIAAVQADRAWIELALARYFPDGEHGPSEFIDVPFG
jgi:hypothetical protein